MGVDEPTIRKICGDGLSLNLRSNEQILEVTGDGCSITMSKNHGSVKIIGDGCRLRIDRNMGDVEYTGDGGQVLLGPKSTNDKVKYTGDGGRISLNGESWKKNRKSKEDTDKKVNVKGSTKEKQASRSQEDAENTFNEGKDVKRNEERRNGKSTKFRIITSIDCDEKNVKRWFVCPETVVKNFNGAAFVKIEPKSTKTKIEVKRWEDYEKDSCDSPAISVPSNRENVDFNRRADMFEDREETAMI
ncbi:hypothetical protein WH47_00254 [Habropoda laboriosa]|uniref:Uncharacterized protein n=1 Tax=Habropoda laboriosa TaxID=597456 RepID=A0A0L7R1T6_9HYME|nr:PREDICTED: uncharacterized protein LOC108573010 [Habropoda laboriosa]KOC64751.1 hypothetical protein WH47_00254 [Habropoda laboriosa]